VDCCIAPSCRRRNGAEYAEQEPKGFAKESEPKSAERTEPKQAERTKATAKLSKELRRLTDLEAKGVENSAPFAFCEPVLARFCPFFAPKWGISNFFENFQTFFKKGIDKGKRVWYNSQAAAKKGSERSLKIEQQREKYKA
jgi:hypothetical protein